MILQDTIDTYRSINEKLFMYDWFVSPYYSGLEVNSLKNTTDRLTSPTSKEHKEKVGRMLGDKLIKGNLDYHFRSIIIFEGYRVTPNLKKFSHIF